jgi:type I restriction enzyme M protein
MAPFGKTRPLTVADFADFEAAYGKDAFGKDGRNDQGEFGRFRYFTRAEVDARNDDLDIFWLRDTNGNIEDNLVEPEDIAAAIIGHLRAVTEEMEAIIEELSPDSQQEAA